MYHRLNVEDLCDVCCWWLSWRDVKTKLKLRKDCVIFRGKDWFDEVVG